MRTQFNTLLADLAESRQQYKENLVERAKSLRGMVSGGESRKLAKTLQEIPKEIVENDGPIRSDEDEEEEEGKAKDNALSEEGQAEEESVADENVSIDLATEGVTRPLPNEHCRTCWTGSLARIIHEPS